VPDVSGSAKDDGRPGDDPDQTQYHFGFRFIWFWVMPLFVVGGAFLFWAQLNSGEGIGLSRGQRFVFIYPIGVVAWIVGLVQFHRAKRRGETPVPGSYKPRRPS
jgi:hypothetical protein